MEVTNQNLQLEDFTNATFPRTIQLYAKIQF